MTESALMIVWRSEIELLRPRVTLKQHIVAKICKLKLKWLRLESKKPTAV